MEPPHLPPPGLVSQGNFGIEGGCGAIFRELRSAGPAWSGSGFVAEEQAQERAENFEGTLGLNMFTGIEVNSPLVKERLL